MNDYDDSEDYASANSFRARSNTWPLNRPDLAVPNSVCIDETLPEIELEEDDLFTTNENWSTSNMVDHDIMSWDPILNAQHHHQQQQQQQQQHQQTLNNQTHLLNNTNNQQLLTNQNVDTQQQQPFNSGHQQQQQQHMLHQQPPPPHTDTIQQASSNLTQDVSSNPSNQQQQGLNIQTQHLHNIQPSQQHTTLDSNDPNEYHLQQLHHLRIDNSHTVNHHYNLSPTLSSPSSSANNNNMGTSSASTLTLSSYNLPSDHQQHNHLDHDHHHQRQQQQQQRQLQSLSSANYNDLDHHHHHQHNELNLISHDPAANGAQHHGHHHNHHHHDPHMLHHQHHHHHQMHHLTCDTLDQNPLIMSTAGDNTLLGIGGDLEDLDYNKVVDPSTILQDPTQHYEKQQDQEDLHQSPQNQQHQPQTQQQQQPTNSEDPKIIDQSTSTTCSKTKLNTPRRNAWGNMSYADLISQAINSTTDKRLTLSQIYDWMVQHVPYFKDKGDSNSSAGWKNSVRHNLSLHNRFKRLQNEGTGKSSWWTINPETNVGKCARRRAASMEASKYEKKRGKAKKRADAIRQGLVSYPSLTSSLLNGSSGNLDASDLQKIQASSSTANQVQPKQEVENPNSDSGHNQPVDSGLYNPQYEQKDIELHQMQQEQQQQQQPQMSHSPPQKALPLHETQQDVEVSSQQQQQQQLSDQVQQIHQIVHNKTEQADFDSYYIQHNHQDLHQLQNHQGHLDSRDQIDLFNRHAIYLSEPCNDCNCTELINCGTNAMSYT